MHASGKLNRRALLKQGASAGIGLTVLLPRRASAATPPAPANSRLNLGFIGVGGKGGSHLRGLLGYSNVQVLAVCEVDGNRAANAKKTVESFYAKGAAYQGCTAYGDFRELVARDDLDAVVIATPDHWHALTSIAAANAGLDIYCEKPLALTIHEGRAMVNAVRRNGRVFQTGSQQRSSGKFKLACELIRSGRIGQLKTIHVAVGPPSTDCCLPAEPVPKGLNWDAWLGPAPWRPFNSKIHPYKWRSYRDYSGGQMTDWGAHHFDIAQWAMDMDNSGPREIHPPDGKDFDRLTYVYENGVQVFHCRDGGRSVFQRVSGNGLLFTGTEGKIEVNRKGFYTWPESIGQTPLGPNDVHLYEDRGHQSDWLACIETRERPVADVEVGHRSVTVSHLGNLAYWLNRPLHWDPAREEFLDDPEANRWLDRPKRPPWDLI